MLEEALARSPLRSLSITRSYASSSRIGSPSWEMPSRYVQRIKSHAKTVYGTHIWNAQHWKENMPEALESGRVRIQGSSFFFFASTLGLLGLEQDSTFCVLKKRSRLLYATTRTARGRLGLHPLKSNARLVRRVLPHDTQTSTRRRGPKDATGHRRAGNAVRQRGTRHAGDSGRGASRSSATIAPEPCEHTSLPGGHFGKKCKSELKPTN